MQRQTFEEMVKIMTRGQITIPFKIRRMLDIEEKTWLALKVRGDEIVLKPIRKIFKEETGESPFIQKAKYSKKEFLKILKNQAKMGPFWSEKDYQDYLQRRKEQEARDEKIRKGEPYWKN